MKLNWQAQFDIDAISFISIECIQFFLKLRRQA